MNVEFFVHGVPNGADFWGNDNGERDYCSSFYDGSTDKLKYVIQVRHAGEKTYFFYYNYLLYESVVGNGGRAGSYFGMTLRLDAYCRDFMGIYRVLDMSFHSYVLGSLLVADRSKLKYVAPSFVGFDMRGLCQKVYGLLQDALTNDSLSSIGSVRSMGGRCNKWNLYDCTNESVMDDITNYGKTVMSPYYQSRNESSMQQQYDNKLKVVQGDCESKIDEIKQQCKIQITDVKSAYEQKETIANATIDSLQSQVAQLKTTVSEKSNKIEELQLKVNDLKKGIELEGQSRKIAELIECIRQPIKDLADMLGRGRKKRSRGWRIPKVQLPSPRRLRYVILLLAMSLLLGLVYMKFHVKNLPARRERTQTITEQVDRFSHGEESDISVVKDTLFWIEYLLQ